MSGKLRRFTGNLPVKTLSFLVPTGRKICSQAPHNSFQSTSQIYAYVHLSKDILLSSAFLTFIKDLVSLQLPWWKSILNVRSNFTQTQCLVPNNVQALMSLGKKTNKLILHVYVSACVHALFFFSLRETT